MTLIGCWRLTGTPTQNGVVTVDNNETTPLSPLGGFTKPSESWISEVIKDVLESHWNIFNIPLYIVSNSTISWREPIIFNKI